jgi:hypothetical protein
MSRSSIGFFRTFRFQTWLPVFQASLLAALGGVSVSAGAVAQSLPRSPDQTVECDILIAGGGLAGTAAAYEALQLGHTVCLTEITDWVGGQLTAQGVSALDEAKKQRALKFYPRGYNEFRARVERKYGRLNPGECWVSVSCFLPSDAKVILTDMLREAERQGKGKLHWFPSTVIKDLGYSPDGTQITRAIAIQHQPAPGAAPLNTQPLSQTIEDAYRYENSAQFTKQIIQFSPKPLKSATGGEATQPGTPWIVMDATETGELVALADVPYRVGLDPRTSQNPSSPTDAGDPYCTQGFTYTFAMEQTAEPRSQQKPSFYAQYEPYYGYDPDPKRADFDYVFTYRRIWNPLTPVKAKAGPFTLPVSTPGSISMQNWVWGNDYRPGSAIDNLIYTRRQLEQTGQLAPGGWLGGLRTETLRKGEEIALGFYYWLVAGNTDLFLGPSVKKQHPNHQLLTGLDSPMGTLHGLSKYPYIREGRRIIGRPSATYRAGFSIGEIDISKADFRSEYYRNLPDELYADLWRSLAGLKTYDAIVQDTPPEQIERRTRSRIFPDAIGIAQYAIDFHPCMATSPPELAGNAEYPGVRQAHGQAYPAQIPLRAMIPQKLDNLLVIGKSIATSYSAAAMYRVHSFEWSAGAAAGITAAFVLTENLLPYQLVDELPRREPKLEQLQQQLQERGNPTAFPNTSIFNLDWEEWKVW